MGKKRTPDSEILKKDLEFTQTGALFESTEPLLGDEPDDGWVPLSASCDKVEEKKPSCLWIVTFTDAMALMLTFFVLLYAMSTPDAEKWEDMTRGVSAGVSKFVGAEYFAGEQDTVAIDKLSAKEGLNLKYLGAIIYEITSQNSDLKDTLIFIRPNSLLVSLPSELLFDEDGGEVSVRGKRALLALSELLKRIRNRIEVVGHIDPVSSDQSTREVSLLRATYVAAVLNDIGYDRPITVRGLSRTRYDEISNDMDDETRRIDLSRRVDIVVMKDEVFYPGMIR